MKSLKRCKMDYKTYVVSYTLDNENYRLYLSATSPEEAQKEVLLRNSLVVIKSVTRV